MPAANHDHHGPAHFPSTRWSRILAQPGERDLEELARSYWRPIHGYLRSRLRLTDDDARDLTQDAFAWILESGLFERADPRRGSFRGFLKTALGNFAIEHLRRQGAERRGGHRVHVALDAGTDGAPLELADPGAKPPEQVLDEAWRRELLERAVAAVQEELEASGRGAYFRVFRDYFLDDAPELDYAAVAARHGVSRTDVSNWLDYAKRRFREILRQQVLETVRDDAELQAELRWLFGKSAP